MTKKELNGLVILLKADKSLVQTKRIRVFQREKLVDRMRFLIPIVYEDWDGSDDTHPDMSVFTVMLQYIGQDGTVHQENLVRMPDGNNGYEDYEDSDGNATHMIYQLPIDTNLTAFAGDITLKLNLQYIRYEGHSESPDDETDAEEPQPVQYVLNSDTTVLTVLPIADYYSVVPDESLSYINNKMAELDGKIEEFKATAAIYDESKADNIELDEEGNELYLTSKGRKIGDSISMKELSEEIIENSDEGMVTVVI